ncbi:hypothetical protein D9756_008411 [Leucocoprinus leucothites]|uniref:G domain-containing protein n=1 Tax=Leucocoprinus leucothites TaxID=201217 RepID=A0A8H5CZV6_9AGAR|nr:hypothetical protein D9756_008411 [Leucoagaricus leucothites]
MSSNKNVPPLKEPVIRKAIKSLSDPLWLKNLPRLSKPPRRANTDLQPKKLSREMGYEVLSVVELTGVQQLTPEDIIVAVMGPTGTGKSTFIQRTTNYSWIVGHSLQSHTSVVKALRVSFSDGISLVLVDTPGFDDTNKSDLEILKIIAKWFEQVYRRKLEISGILYLHRITDNRMGGTPRKNLELFKKVCGEDYFPLMVLVTTMWSERSDEDEAVFFERESQLQKDYWGDIIKDPAQVQRFRGTQSSAWNILEEVFTLAAARQRHKILEIQQELVDLSKQVPDTSAGQQLHGMMEELVGKQSDLVRRLQDELIKSSDPVILRAIMGELRDLQQQREKVQKDLRRMGPSLAERRRRLNGLLFERSGPLRRLTQSRLHALKQKLGGFVQRIVRTPVQSRSVS